MADFSTVPVSAMVKLAVNNDAGSNSAVDTDADQVQFISRKGCFGQGCQIRLILNIDRHIQGLLQFEG